MMILNTIVAHQLVQFKKDVDALTADGKTSEEAVILVLQRYIGECERAIFNGNGYSAEWEIEAKQRGLKNIKSTPDALKALITKEAETIFSEFGIFNHRELHARYHVMLEQYIKEMEIEMLVTEEMVHTHILPSVFQYINTLTEAFKGFREMGMDKAAEKTREEAEVIYHHFSELRNQVQEMMKLKETAFQENSEHHIAELISEKIKPVLENIRQHADQLEKLTDDTFWRLPKYRELLFVR